MKTPTYEEYLADPSAVIAQVQLEAQHERARAVHRYLIEPLARACGKLLAIRGVKVYLDPRPMVSQ